MRGRGRPFAARADPASAIGCASRARRRAPASHVWHLRWLARPDRRERGRDAPPPGARSAGSARAHDARRPALRDGGDAAQRGVARPRRHADGARRGGDRLQRRDLQLGRAAGRARGRGSRLHDPDRHRGGARRLPGVGTGVPPPDERHVRDRDLARGQALPGPRSTRQEAPLLHPEPRGPGLRLGAQGHPGAPLRRGPDLPGARVLLRRAHALPQREERSAGRVAPLRARDGRPRDPDLVVLPRAPGGTWTIPRRRSPPSSRSSRTRAGSASWPTSR